jgi:hypothetical protein
MRYTIIFLTSLALAMAPSLPSRKLIYCRKCLYLPQEIRKPYDAGKNMAILYTVKKISHFPVPIRDVTNQTLPARE